MENALNITITCTISFPLIKQFLHPFSSISIKIYQRIFCRYQKKTYGLWNQNLTQSNIRQLIVKGSLTVRTTKKTFDPYAIIKARDVIKLISRSVPFYQALRVMEDGHMFEIVKDLQKGGKGQLVQMILTKCYILVQGSTVCIIGDFKNVKILRRIIIDTMNNIHPIYNIKQLMIKKELDQNEELKNQNWQRFLPKFKKIRMKKKKKNIKPKKPYETFPPQPLPRNEDIEMQTGQYFLTETQKQKNKRQIKKKKQQQKQKIKINKQVKQYQENNKIKEIIRQKDIAKEQNQEISLDQLKKRFNVGKIKRIQF